MIFDVRSIPVEEKIRWDYKISCRIVQMWYDGVTLISNGTRDFVENSFNIKYKKYSIFSSAVNPALFSRNLTINVPINIK